MGLSREEAYKLREQGFSNEHNMLIDAIYDDFESRTCVNCRYYTQHNRHGHRCSNESSIAYNRHVKIGDGCNRFQRCIFTGQ